MRLIYVLYTFVILWSCVWYTLNIRLIYDQYTFVIRSTYDCFTINVHLIPTKSDLRSISFAISSWGPFYRISDSETLRVDSTYCSLYTLAANGILRYRISHIPADGRLWIYEINTNYKIEGVTTIVIVSNIE